MFGHTSQKGVEIYSSRHNSDETLCLNINKHLFNWRLANHLEIESYPNSKYKD